VIGIHLDRKLGAQEQRRAVITVARSKQTHAIGIEVARGCELDNGSVTVAREIDTESLGCINGADNDVVKLRSEFLSSGSETRHAHWSIRKSR